jgi:hypothetical protein
MSRKLIMVAAASVALATAAPMPAAAAPADDLASLQQQLNALKSEYDAKINALEARLKAAEDKAGSASAAAPAEAPAQAAQADLAPGEVVIPDQAEATPAAEPAVRTAAANAMNPGISVVLNGNYVAMSRDPAAARIPGFPLSDEAQLPPRGFSLGESEITLAANVDPYFTANLTASLGADDTASVEEAYVQTTALPAGLTLKGGRFFSAVGYLNERHAHNWSFIDMPLPYRAFLGNQYGDDGVQLRWLAPTPFFLELGGELYRGDSFPAGNAAKSRAGTQTAFVHTGGDINDDSSWLAALSYLHAEAHDLDTAGEVFNGDTGLGIASVVYKWAPGGNPTKQNLVLSGEYFRGRQDGLFDGLAASRDLSGWYAQGVYQFTNRWSTGLRYAQLDSVGVPASLLGSGFDGLGRTPRAISALLEYDTSEFARFRAELTRDLSDTRSNDQLMLQYTVVYGPHGAHRY